MATEKRLIDAKAGKKRFCAIAKPAEYNGVIHLVVPISEIDKLPTVDATLTVHAHWDEWWPGDCALIMTGEEMLYQCSACTAKFSDVEGFQYCPHCGALMEGINHAESDDQA